MLRRQAPGSAGSPSARLPADQPLVDRVPLPPRVLGQVGLVDPVPLDDRGLDQRGRGLRVVLEQPRRAAGAVVPEVEAAVDARRVVRRLHRQPHVRVFVVVRPGLRVAVEPGPDDLLVRVLRDADLGQEAASPGCRPRRSSRPGGPARCAAGTAGPSSRRPRCTSRRASVVAVSSSSISACGEVVVRPLLPVRDHRPVRQLGVVVGQAEAEVGEPPAVADRTVRDAGAPVSRRTCWTTCRCRCRPCRPRWS